MLAEAILKSAKTDLAYARIAFKAAPGDVDAVRQLAKAVQTARDADGIYMAAMTAGLAAQISEIVPDAFRQ